MSYQRLLAILFIITFSNTIHSRYLHNSLKNLNLKGFPTSKTNHLSFLNSYLKKSHNKKTWHYLGDRPSNDIKYKKLIANSLKDSFMTLYMNLMDDHRVINLIFGKVKRKNGQTIMKLVFVIKNKGVNETYFGVQFKFNNEKYFCEHKHIQILRFGKSLNCKDILNLLHISVYEFKRGPSLDFINKYEAGKYIWKHFSRGSRDVYMKNLNDLIKMQMLEFNTWLSKMGLIMNSSKPNIMSNIHPLVSLNTKENPDKEDINIGSGYQDDTDIGR